MAITEPPAPTALTAAVAYARAPSIISEIGWTADQAATRPFGTQLPREFWLRKAAVLDRIALDDENAHILTDAPAVADAAARRLMECDGATGTDPRGYVRAQYAAWTRQHTTHP
ncbi:hypothetical protein DY218_28585 [Streptomyces triticagri]|uniref:Uncharacterized protein n=1 Tax=Streptomyces triticagri TaxID=2293568 RepID=A0A372LYZ8_9ACTN|nr:hypothetical protein [Streptomyces triticagri]RFU83267.1 hypothetical protein DY218_28585 [Streptomyces triticagri]